MMKHKWKTTDGDNVLNHVYCKTCGIVQNINNVNKGCKGHNLLRPFEKMSQLDKQDKKNAELRKQFKALYGASFKLLNKIVELEEEDSAAPGVITGTNEFDDVDEILLQIGGFESDPDKVFGAK